MHFFPWFSLLALHVISNSNVEIVHGAAYIENQATVEDKRIMSSSRVKEHTLHFETCSACLIKSQSL